ncbi:NLR family CARD domain-containing protein 3 isoform X4 [Loxodonta africana]|uniref:NLR family CARD domain-containing protein 3 isoform X4 n=1 Tax=Loxodonta africana TaxID=9785 RepID=UPI0030D24D8C
MQKQEVWAWGEAGAGRGSGSPAEQLKTLMDLLARKGSQGTQAPQASDRMLEPPLEPPSSDYRIRRHQEVLLSRLGGGLELGGPPPRLASLLLVEGLTDLQLREHDFTQVEATRGARRTARTITLGGLFLPLSRVSVPPRVSITVGVAGVGKTTLVRHFVCLWARGQLAKDFSLVLPLTFRELNTHEKVSADRLICSAFPHVGEPSLAAGAPARVLLILDGLDECKTPLDFSNTVACTDPKKEIQVDNLITNIIRGNLFPEVSVWVTSRPSTAGQIPGGLVDRITEIRGFNQEEVKACLERMFAEDRSLTGWVLAQVHADRALYLMCTIPAFCRLAGLALGHMYRHRRGTLDTELSPPRTLSEIYSWYFRMALGREGQDKSKVSPHIEQVAHGGRRMAGTLGRLAFHGLVRKKYVFYEQDLKAFGVDVALLQSALCGCFLQQEETLGSSAVYCFSHLSLQEFVAAAYYYGASKRAIFDLFTDSGVSWPRLGFLTHFRSAVQRAMQAEDGRLDVFLRFLSGLLSPRVNALLMGSLLAPGEHQGYRAQAARILQGCLAPEVAVSARAVNVLRCLHELQHTELARSMEEAMECGGLAILTSPPHRAALAYLLQVSDTCAQEANLSLCLDQVVLQSLLPQLLYCQSLRLDTNQFQDPVMELLGSVLSGKDCRIQKISLAENQISNKGAKALARSLLVNRSLTALDLRGNSIGPQGAKALADALKINRTLASLSLQSNAIKDDGAGSIAEALASNRTLCMLCLQKNTIGPVGAQRMADALKQNRSLKELIFSSNSISDRGAKALAEALKPAEQFHQRHGGGCPDRGPLHQPGPPQPQPPRKLHQSRGSPGSRPCPLYQQHPEEPGPDGQPPPRPGCPGHRRGSERKPRTHLPSPAVELPPGQCGRGPGTRTTAQQEPGQLRFTGECHRGRRSFCSGQGAEGKHGPHCSLFTRKRHRGGWGQSPGQCSEGKLQSPETQSSREFSGDGWGGMHRHCTIWKPWAPAHQSPGKSHRGIWHQDDLRGCQDKCSHVHCRNVSRSRSWWTRQKDRQ